MADNRMLRWMLAPALASALLVGCGRSPEPVYQTWATRPQAYVPQPGSTNAFDAYALAAKQVESVGGKHLDRVSFFPGQRQAAMQTIAEPFKAVVAATSKPCEFRFVPHEPFDKLEFHKGWRLIGRVFQWKVEDALAAEDYATAVSMTLAGTRFGMDLTGGGAMDASLGLNIVDDVRKAMLPHLATMPPEQLMRLSEGLREALGRKAPLDRTIDNEYRNMMLGVQEVQDAYKENRLKELQAKLGSSTKEAIEYLDAFHRLKEEKRLAYFEGFAAEADELCRTAKRKASLTGAAREELKPKLAAERPWRRLARHFFGTLDPLLAMHDVTVARTRMLIVASSIMAQKEKGFPPDLKAFDPKWTQDPFSGRPLLYRVDAGQFLIYSVGPNLRDDGGDADASFDGPDLRLEAQW